MKYLLNVVETYRVDTVEEALEMREEMSQDPAYELTSFQYASKYDKKTDTEYQVAKVKKIVNAEKDPKNVTKVRYDG